MALQPVDPGLHVDDIRFQADPFGVVGQCCSGGVICFGLGVDVVGHRPGRRPAVVQHLGDVMDLPGLLGDPQRQVVVLAAVVAGPKPAGALHQRAADHSR